MVQEAVGICGQIDILHNNAGIDLPQATNVIATEIEDWDRILGVNLKGPFFMARAAKEALDASGEGVNLRSLFICDPGEVANGHDPAYDRLLVYARCCCPDLLQSLQHDTGRRGGVGRESGLLGMAGDTAALHDLLHGGVSYP